MKFLIFGSDGFIGYLFYKIVDLTMLVLSELIYIKQEQI